MAAIRQFFWNVVAHLLARPVVADWLIRRAQRTPYSPIIKNGQLYMERFWLFNPYPDTGESGADRRGGFPISVRIHHIVLPDQDRHLHDHPWNARTIILRGYYDELRLEQVGGTLWDLDFDDEEEVRYRRAAGATAPLNYGQYHCISELSAGGAWTLFICGRYRGGWGFMVDGVKVPWRTYLGLPEKVVSAEDIAAASDRNFQRAVWMELLAIYGLFVALAAWNWW